MLDNFFSTAIDAREVLRLAIGDNFVLYLLRFLRLFDNEPVFKLLPKTDGVNMLALNFAVQVISTVAVPRVIFVKNVVLFVARLGMNLKRCVINLSRLKALFNHRLSAQDASRLLRGCVRVHLYHLLW
jgi:hypothetical protein